MASTDDVAKLPDELCPACGSPFARDLKQRGFRRHKERRPIRDPKAGGIKTNAQGKLLICGGTSQSWGKGKRS
jgi:hypothetical protein